MLSWGCKGVCQFFLEKTKNNQSFFILRQLKNSIVGLSMMVLRREPDLWVFIIKGIRLHVINELPKILLIVLLIYCLFKVLKLEKEQTTCISHV